MSKYIDVDLLRKEIERQRQFIGESFTEGDNTFYDGQDDAYCYILAFLAFLDSIQEQPVIKKSNVLFKECLANVDPAIRKEVSDNVDKILGRQPVEGMEEAAIQAAQSDMQDRQIMEASNDERMRYSRIFRRGFKAGAEWGAEHLKR